MIFASATLKSVATVNTVNLSEQAPVKPSLWGGTIVEVSVKLSKRPRPYAAVPLVATVHAKIVQRAFEAFIRKGEEVSFVAGWAQPPLLSYAIDAHFAVDVAAAVDLLWLT